MAESLGNCQVFFTPKRFSLYGVFVVTLNTIAGFIAIGGTANLRTRETKQFLCKNDGRFIDKDFMQTKCFHQYDQIYNSPLPLYGFVLLSFLMPAFVCFVYWCCVKSRVDEVEQACKPRDPENPRPTPRTTTRLVFRSYLVQLVVRCALRILFASLQNQVAYPNGFPSEFLCQWDSSQGQASQTSNVTYSNTSVNIECLNSVGSDKTVWDEITWSSHIIFAFLVFFETVYLIVRALGHNDFMFDSDFCQNYLLGRSRVPVVLNDFRRHIDEQTMFLEPLIPHAETPGEHANRKAVDDIYVDLIIHSGRVTHLFDMSKKRHEIFDVYLEPPKASIKIENLKELFLSNEDSRDPRKILIVGRPGIGKSLLCKKLLREWSSNTEQKFKCVFLYAFRHFNSEPMATLTLGDFLSRAEHSIGKIDDSVLQYIVDNPEKILIIFDGLDEFKYRNCCIKDEEDCVGSKGVTEIPVSALYIKLLKNKLLPGATIVTTTRPNAVDSVITLRFDRSVEILGFTHDKVQTYVDKCFCDDSIKATAIWQHIQTNLNLLYLCYIPATCKFVCDVLEFCLNHDSFTLPTTLTEVYKGVLRVFIFNHHPDYQSKTNAHDFARETFLPSVEESLLKLGSLARKGIDERRLIFEEEEVEGLENCGFLNCMPPNKKVLSYGYVARPQYCFIHLTLQEFLAAIEITKMGPYELGLFIKEKADNADWHLVIQFVAGLLKGQNVEVVTDAFVSILVDCLPLGKEKALLMLQCLHELDDNDVVERAASQLISNSQFQHCVKLKEIGITPVDCTAIVFFLKHLGTSLRYLNLSFNSGFGDSGCSELSKLIKEGGPEELDISSCNITDQGFKELLGAVCEKDCRLTDLNMAYNDGGISDQGMSALREALKHGNCKLTKLNLYCNGIIDEAVSHLCEALKHGNCKLTALNLGYNKFTDEGVRHLCEALKHGNCRLSELNLRFDKFTDEGISHLCEALTEHENFGLGVLHLENNEITDKGLLHLCEALKHEKCRITNLYILKGNEFTGESLTHLYEAVRYENRHCNLR